MKIKATDKALYECAPITLQGNGLTPEQITEFRVGKTIEVDDAVGALFLEHQLATESEASDGVSDLQSEG